MQFSDENLIAYLLGDASPELRNSIETSLATDSDLCDRLAQLRQMLGHMDSLAGVFEPPGDLVESTMRRIEEEELSRKNQPAKTLAITAELSDVKTGGSDRSRNRLDSLMLSLSLCLLCCLILPSILIARFHSRRIQCAHQLADLGRMMIDYSVNHPSGRLPAVGTDENTGFAGIVPVRLKTAGYPVVRGQLQCPSLIGYETASSPIIMDSIPTVQQWQEMVRTVGNAASWRQALGGDYAYNLGVAEQNLIVAPRCQGRASFAILSDAPIFVQDGEEVISHDGRGLNILYENGRVDFIRVRELPTQLFQSDYPFRNHRGAHAFGLDDDDSSLAPSPFSPLGQMR